MYQVTKEKPRELGIELISFLVSKRILRPQSPMQISEIESRKSVQQWPEPEFARSSKPGRVDNPHCQEIGSKRVRSQRLRDLEYAPKGTALSSDLALRNDQGSLEFAHPVELNFLPPKAPAPLAHPWFRSQ